MPENTRLLIVSNRLPVSVDADAAEMRLVDASGGLATGLSSWYSSTNAIWIGWPGETSELPPMEREKLSGLLASRRVAPVFLASQDVELYYDGFSNRVLWPLFHYLVDRVPVAASGWQAYREVNEKFADAVLNVYRPGDAVWVHDYQLMLVPGLLRERCPDARIGFFLHIPFPSSEVFRILPWRRELLRGLLGADLIGFHTFAYLRHFLTSLLHIEGIESQIDCVHLDGRQIQAAVFPMGVDARAFETLANDPEVIAEAAALRRDAGGRRILLGVDRLDYTKGIPRRLLALERLLEEEPDLRDGIRYIQIAVPSREKIDSYQKFRRHVEETVGRINGARGTLRSTPIHYIHRCVSRRELVALYCAADVLLVTPLRDGMNLVAKEFVASRTDADGVLVLSEFAGAADELGEAVVINPYDVDGLAAGIRQALAMPPAVRRVRMESLRRRVLEHDVHRWAARFIERLNAVPRARPSAAAAAPPLDERMAMLGVASRLAVLLDYDGTLVPIAQTPELAVPDQDLLALLTALAGRPGTDVHLVSGRPRDVLDRWFHDVPISLWAEHGTFHRRGPEAAWEATVDIPRDWIDRVLPIFDQFTASTPGSLIERKTASVAWHYRIAHAEFGARQAHELRMLLGDALSNQPMEVLEGRKVIEVRLRGVSKALVAHRILASSKDPAVLAVGDDRTDEEMFAALPDSSVRVAVGRRAGRAPYRLVDWRAARDLLRRLLAAVPQHSG